MSTLTPSDDVTFAGHGGALVGRAWTLPDPRWIAVLAHGYGEHVGRYAWVAGRLNDAGAAVYAADHVGHGRSDGARVLIEDFEPVVADLDVVVRYAREQHPDVPIVLLGHSLGGMIAARYTQIHPDRSVATVLSGPVLGSWAIVDELLALEEIPSTPIDPETLSRDPAVGATYAEDELVWHGDFKRPTLEAIQRCLAMITAAGTVGDHPLLYLHGEDDHLVPPGASRVGLRAVEGSATRVKTYPGARHEILNETNRAEVVDDLIRFVEGMLAGRG